MPFMKAPIWKFSLPGVNPIPGIASADAVRMVLGKMPQFCPLSTDLAIAE